MHGLWRPKGSLPRPQTRRPGALSSLRGLLLVGMLFLFLPLSFSFPSPSSHLQRLAGRGEEHRAHRGLHLCRRDRAKECAEKQKTKGSIREMGTCILLP
jgi:hypothetical protein